MKLFPVVVIPLLASLTLVQPSRPAQPQARNYDKIEYQIPMRDGVKLYTVVYVPKDRTQKYPILMMRTPYSAGPYGKNNYRFGLGPNRLFSDEGYIFAYQDVRGCYMSEGKFVNMTPHRAKKTNKTDIDESSDAYDTIEYLLKHVPANNGRVGLWGISYPGFYAAASMIDAHPALKAVSPQAPIADWWYDDFHHHGAFFLQHAFHFLSVFGQPRPEPTPRRNVRLVDYGTRDAYQFYLDLGSLKNADAKYFKGRVAFWNEMCDHPNYDEFWQARNLLPHLKKVAPAVLTVGGWFDAEDLYGPLKIYRTVEKNNPNVFNVLCMGPWRHGGWSGGPGDKLGDIHFGSAAGEFYRKNIELPFFNYHLKDKGKLELPEAYVFETGNNRWRQFDAWPPKKTAAKKLYFRAGGKLSFEPPTEAEGYDEYISDPAKPVPYSTREVISMSAEYMVDDQRFASRRPDVLVYQTEPLKQDITLAGPLLADLRVSTSGTDSDWVVKLIDVFPPGYKGSDGAALGHYQMMVRSEVIRGRFRDDPSKPKAFVPNQPTTVKLQLQDVLHTFKKGHRIMFHVQSTWFPLVDRNPQKFVENIYKADEKDFVKATQRVYRNATHPTSVEVGVLAD